MPNPFDIALAATFAVAWPLFNYLVQWPAHVKRIAAGDRDARIRLFGTTILEQWALVAILAVIWFAFGRPLESLGLRLPSGWRLAVGFGLPVVYAILISRQVPAIARDEKIRERLRVSLEPLRPLLPHRAAEWRWFMPLSVTAGICEELLFRGYLVWVLQPWLGLYGAAGLSAALFGVAHGYQGLKFGTRATLAGAFMGAFALLTGSIVPGMLLHALIDLGSGYAGYVAVREPEGLEAAHA